MSFTPQTDISCRKLIVTPLKHHIFENSLTLRQTNAITDFLNSC